MGENVALWFFAGGHPLYIVSSHFLQWRAGQHMNMPGLGIHGIRRALRDRDNLVDDIARDRVLLVTAHAPARVHQSFEFYRCISSLLKACCRAALQ